MRGVHEERANGPGVDPLTFAGSDVESKRETEKVGPIPAHGFLLQSTCAVA
jgi:hypothetical protein